MYDLVAWSGGADFSAGAGFEFGDGPGFPTEAEMGADLASFYRCEVEMPGDALASADASQMPNQSLLELPPPDVAPPLETLSLESPQAREPAPDRGSPPSPGLPSPDLFHRVLGFTVIDEFRPEAQVGASPADGSVRPTRDSAAEAASEASREANRFASGAALNAGVVAADVWTGGARWADAVIAARSPTIDGLPATDIADREIAIGPGTIQVQPGDSFDRIARRWAPDGASEAQVHALRDRYVAANPQVDDVNRLRVGQTLNQPGVDTVVDRGTLARIAGADARYQASRTSVPVPSSAGLTLIDGTGLSTEGASFASLAQTSPSMFEPVAPFLLGRGGQVVANLAHVGPQAQPVPMIVPPLAPSDGGVRVLGALEAVGGLSQMTLGTGLIGVGAASSTVGVGLPLVMGGGLLVAGGADHVEAGLKTAWTGEPHPTRLVTTLEALGMPPLAAVGVDLALNGGGSIAAGGWLRTAGSVSTFATAATGAGGERIVGTAARPTVQWMANADGAVRTPDEMMSLARQAGVSFPDGVKVFWVKPHQLLNADGAHAEYSVLQANIGGRIGNAANLRPNDVVTWESFQNKAGAVPVRISTELLRSDEAAIAHLAHESFELRGLFESLEIRGKVMTYADLNRLVRPVTSETGVPLGGVPNNLHERAWDYADRVILDRRGP